MVMMVVMVVMVVTAVTLVKVEAVVVGHHLHHRRRYHRRIIRTDRMPEVSLKTEVQLRDSASTETSASNVFCGTLMYP